MMAGLSIILLCLGLLVSGLIGITLSLPLQSPGLILMGLSGLAGAAVVFRGKHDLRLLIPVTVSLLYFAIRAVFSPVADLAVEDLFLILAAGLFYLLAGSVCGTPKLRVSIAMVLLLLLCLHLGSVFLQFAGGEGYGLVWFFTDGGRPEGNAVTGMYGYRGSFANFAIITGMLALCLGIWGRFPKLLRIVFGVLGTAALICACFAHSRSAMISLGAGGGVLFVMLWMSIRGIEGKLRKKLKACMVTLACIGCLAGVIGTVMVFQNRAQASVKGADAMFDSSVRLAFWPMAIEQFADHPIVGAGSRSFSYECFHYWSPNLDTGEANPEFVHNEYLQALADYGFVGFLLIVGLLGGHCYLGVKQIRKLSSRIGSKGLKQGSNAMALAIAGVVGVAVMAVHVVFDFRTHLMANLLLLVCCLVWVLPVVQSTARARGRGEKGVALFMLPLLVGLSGWAIYIGIIQLKGGVPLLQNKMGVEHGTWTPDAVSRSVWIPALEKSILQAPTYRRHLRLGTLYRLEAEQLDGDEQLAMIGQAVDQYQKAAKRHTYEPVSRLNLASLYTYLKEYEKAETYFEASDQLASSRERWFRIHTKWADMQRQWAGSLWQAGNTNEASQHYLESLKILEQAEVKSGDNTDMYMMVIIEYVRMLDGLNEFESADQLFEKAEERLPLHVINSLKQNIRREMGDHYLRKGNYLWYKRQPEEAYKELIKASRSYHIHQIVLKGREDPQWKKGYDEVKRILQFFKNTGVGKAEGD